MYKRYFSHCFVVIIGLLSGFFIQMNQLANASIYRDVIVGDAVIELLISAIIMALLLLTLHVLILKKWCKGTHTIHEKHLVIWDACSFIPLLFIVVGFWGIKITPAVWAAIVIVIFIIKLFGIIKTLSPQGIIGLKGSLGLLFMVSGFAALIYQIAWQRILFATFGINMESVTLIISVFMFGLGVGSLIGGYLSERLSHFLPQMFLICEFAIGVFGLVSIELIKHMSNIVIHGDFLQIALTIFTLLCFPTAMMGATLPILVTYINKTHKHVGGSIGWLYFSNTLGSSMAALLTVIMLFPLMGLQGAVWLAASFNFLIAIVVIGHTYHATMFHFHHAKEVN